MKQQSKGVMTWQDAKNAGYLVQPPATTPRAGNEGHYTYRLHLMSVYAFNGAEDTARTRRFLGMVQSYIDKHPASVRRARLDLGYNSGNMSYGAIDPAEGYKPVCVWVAKPGLLSLIRPFVQGIGGQIEKEEHGRSYGGNLTGSEYMFAVSEVISWAFEQEAEIKS